MPQIEEVWLRFKCADVLQALWYSDGSGARCGVQLLDSPSEYEIIAVELDQDADELWVQLTRTYTTPHRTADPTQPKPESST